MRKTAFTFARHEKNGWAPRWGRLPPIAKRVLAFRKTLEPIRTLLAVQPYVGGGAPAYADYAVFGCFQWARCTSSFPLLLKDDPVWARRDRLLFAFDGFAAKSLGYAV